MNAIKVKLQNCIPGDYRLHWNATKKQPIRYKINSTKQTAEKLNLIWAKEISKATGCKYINGPQYIRINTDYLDHTVTFSIFPNGTIMMQGKTSYTWADEKMEDICRKIQSEIEDSKKSKNDLDESSDSSLFDDSISIKGICIVCNEEDDKNMFHCDIKTCNAWIHYHCDGLDESEASEMPIYYCKFCRTTYNLKIPRRQLNITENSVSSKIVTSLGLPSLPEDDSLNDIESSINTDPELLYLKAVHTSLMNVNDSEDELNDPQEITELKLLAKEVSEVYKKEIAEKEKNIQEHDVSKMSTTVTQTTNEDTKESSPKPTTETEKDENQNNAKSNKSFQDKKSQTFIKNNDEKLLKSEQTIKELKSTINEMKEKLEKSEHEISRVKKLEDKIKELEETNKTANQKLVKSENTSKSLKISLTASEELSQKNLLKIKEQREKIVHLEVENIELTKKVQTLAPNEPCECTSKTEYNQCKEMLEKTQSKLILANTINENLKANLKTVNKDKEILRTKLNKIRSENMPDCINGLHEVEGYCEFRYDMKLTQLKLDYDEVNKKNETLERQIEYDKIVIANQNKLLETAGKNIRTLSYEDAKLNKRNQNLINQKDILSGQADTTLTKKSKTDEEWSTMNESNDELNSSISYSDAVKSTPKKGNESRRVNGAGILDPLNMLIRKSLNAKESDEKPHYTLNERFSPQRRSTDLKHQSNRPKEGTDDPTIKENPNQSANTNRRTTNDEYIYDFFDPQNKRGRPTCKFFTLDKCNAIRCIYYHPPNGNKSSQSNQVCQYHLQKRCVFGDQCRNQHPNLTEY